MNNSLTQYEIARNHLIETGWRGIAGWDRDSKHMSREQRDESAIDLYTKNGHVLLLGAQRGGGFELWYPTQNMKTEDVLAEIDSWAKGIFPRDPEVSDG